MSPDVGWNAKLAQLSRPSQAATEGALCLDFDRF